MTWGLFFSWLIKALIQALPLLVMTASGTLIYAARNPEMPGRLAATSSGTTVLIWGVIIGLVVHLAVNGPGGGLKAFFAAVQNAWGWISEQWKTAQDEETPAA